MQVTDILQRLTSYRELPRAAMEAARLNRDELVPLFIERIERFNAGEDEQPGEEALLIIFHLLGEWGDARAYRPLARMLRADEKRVDDAIGIAITETSCAVMANVCDGDPEPLFDVIRDRQADPFVRSRMFGSLVMLVLRGRIDRERVHRFCVEMHAVLLEQSQNFVWFGWQSTIARLGFQDLVPLVERAFADDHLPQQSMTLADFQADLAATLDDPTGKRWLEDGELEPFTDAIKVLSQWYGFSEEIVSRRLERGDHESNNDALSRELALERALSSYDRASWRSFGFDDAEILLEPVVNPLRHLGRNDPCHCGSGKKYKKCCLQ
jgi:hypothetical protein